MTMESIPLRGGRGVRGEGGGIEASPFAPLRVCHRCGRSDRPMIILRGRAWCWFCWAGP
jgi:hypothetical protein